MKHPLRAAALAAGALLCLSASQAFADLEILGVEDGGSWFSFVRLTTNAANTFDEIRITVTNGATMTGLTQGVSHGAPVTVPETRGTTGSDATSSDFTSASAAFVEAGSRDFSDASWHQQGTIDSTHAVATTTGSALQSLDFWLQFGTDTPLQTPLDGARFFIEAYRSGSLVTTGKVYVHRYATGGPDEMTALDVPAPAALWTGLPMLGGMILLIRRNRRKAFA